MNALFVSARTCVRVVEMRAAEYDANARAFPLLVNRRAAAAMLVSFGAELRAAAQRLTAETGAGRRPWVLCPVPWTVVEAVLEAAQQTYERNQLDDQASP